MLSEAMLVTTVAVTDVERAKRFFSEQLGTQVSVRRGQPNVGQTLAHFEVGDIEASVRELTSRGITFEEYETPKTVGGIAQIGPARGAWFKDPDGNIFGLHEGPVP